MCVCVCVFVWWRRKVKESKGEEKIFEKGKEERRDGNDREEKKRRGAYWQEKDDAVDWNKRCSGEYKFNGKNNNKSYQIKISQNIYIKWSYYSPNISLLSSESII